MERSKGKIHIHEPASCYMIKIYDRDGNVLARVFGDTTKAADAHAAHLVKCWNDQEEGGLVGEMVDALKAYQDASMLLKECNPGVKIALGSGLQLKKADDLAKAVLARAAKEIDNG